MKKIFKSLLYLILFPLLIIMLYFSIAYLFTLFPKKSALKSQKTEHISLIYSTIHTDIVFNIQDINLSLLPQFKRKQKGYLAFGWGDKETYLSTPTTNDFKLSTSLKALFLNTTSLMHVSYISNLSNYQDVKKVKLSKEQKKQLKNSIMQSFDFQKQVYQGYGREDFFYSAKGAYNLINTCNSWVGDKLRDVNVTMPYWTPFSWSVISKY